jgi:hypothetical protein
MTEFEIHRGAAAPRTPRLSGVEITHPLPDGPVSKPQPNSPS